MYFIIAISQDEECESGAEGGKIVGLYTFYDWFEFISYGYGIWKGWWVSIWVVEVWFRRFPTRLSTLLKALGYDGRERKTVIVRLGEKKNGRKSRRRE